MAIFTNLFKQPPKPVRRFEDPQLGLMTFCDSDGTWVGHYNGFEYRISFENSKKPLPELLQYCVDTLNKKSWVKRTLRRHKNQQKILFGKRFEDEIEALHYLNLMFYRHTNELRVVAQLGDGTGDDNEERMWRIEFYGDKCVGMGFDT